MRTHFLTTKAAARHMVKRASGVILAFDGSGPQTLPGLGGFKIALDDLEGHRRQWACELGSQDVRVVTLTTGGVPESLPDTFAARDAINAELDKATLLGRTATLADVGKRGRFRGVGSGSHPDLHRRQHLLRRDRGLEAQRPCR
jgi:enoyl-[acyl-carrier-protein] reductase (NADH)